MTKSTVFKIFLFSSPVTNVALYTAKGIGANDRPHDRDIFRVHDVEMMVRVAKMTDAIVRG